MKRTVVDAKDALRAQVQAWHSGESRADVRVLVYPPELETRMLRELPELAEKLAREGIPVDLVDVSQGFLQEVDRRKGFAERLSDAERRDPWRAQNDMSVLAERYLRKLLQTEVEPPAVCRVLMNLGSLATIVSFSAITNEFFERNDCPSPNVLAFPGEGDDRSLNLLRLRSDTNYRVARI